MHTDVKLLAHLDHLAGIRDGKPLPPVMVDIDPTGGVCNLDCAWCCQAASRASKPAKFMADDTMDGLGKLSRTWGIKAWRISGDSEPLLNKRIDILLSSGRANGIDMGLITNGVYLERPKLLYALKWLGVSLDATTAGTWARLKRAPEEHFHKIIENIKRVRDDFPDLEVSIKFLRWSANKNLGKHQFGAGALPVLGQETPAQQDNAEDAESLAEFAAALGCRHIMKDAYPQDFASTYRFTECHATPLGGVFDADHKFHLCCDARGVYVLTDDYTRDDWQELPRLWGGPKHLELIKSIAPYNCAGCAKHRTNEILETLVFRRSPAAADTQVNFI